MWLKTNPGSAVCVSFHSEQGGVFRGSLTSQLKSGMFRLRKLRGQENVSFMFQIHGILRKIL